VPRLDGCTTLILTDYSPNVVLRTFLHSLLRSRLRFFLSTMPSYTTIFVLALAASNVSPALSAPVLYGGLHL
jgi:hypothetical protein